MDKTNEVLISQMVTVGFRIAWNIPRIRDGNKWRNIKNSQLVRKDYMLGDTYKDAIMDVKHIMEQQGWSTEISELREQCHEQLYYRHLNLRCWKQNADNKCDIANSNI